MPAPGHVDFGFYTTFPHCPRCKRGTGERWSEYSQEPTTCRSCGYPFIPAANASSEPDDYEPPDLKERLSAEEYAAVCKAWQARHGSDPNPLDRFFKR